MIEYSVLPLRNTVLFPAQIIPIYIGREQSLQLINDMSSKDDKTIVVVSQKDGSVEHPKSDDIYHVGTLATVMKVFSMPDKSKSVIVKGIKRIKIKKVIQDYPYFKANIENLEEDNQITEDVQHITSNLKNLFANLIDIAPYLSDEQSNIISNIQDPSKFADKAISLLNISTQEKQLILEELDIAKKIGPENSIELTSASSKFRSPTKIAYMEIAQTNDL